jgi:hypothetical protein
MLLGYFFNLEMYPASILNFTPEKFDFKSEKPIYYSVNNSLFFSESGQYGKGIKIWTEDLENFYHSFVSPDSRYIAIGSSDKLIIIKNDGTIIDTISPFKEIFDKKLKEGEYFFIDEIQWSSDSRFFILNKQAHLDKFPWTQENKGSLVKYDVEKKELVKIFDNFPETTDLYLSKDSKYVYYSYFNNSDEKVVIKREIDDGNNSTISRGSDCDNKNQEEINALKDKDLFINYDPNLYYLYPIMQLFEFQQEGKNNSLYYSKGESKIWILDWKEGYSALEGRSTTIENESHFGQYLLPGKRYAIYKVYSKEFIGSLVVDTVSGKYTTIPENSSIYFNLNTEDYLDANMNCGEFTIELSK